MQVNSRNIKTYPAVGEHVVVGLRRVDFGEKETCLGTSVLRVDVSWHWET